jgi:hypothetical protein
MGAKIKCGTGFGELRILFPFIRLGLSIDRRKFPVNFLTLNQLVLYPSCATKIVKSL